MEEFLSNRVVAEFKKQIVNIELAILADDFGGRKLHHNEGKCSALIAVFNPIQDRLGAGNWSRLVRAASLIDYVQTGHETAGLPEALSWFKQHGGDIDCLRFVLGAKIQF